MSETSPTITVGQLKAQLSMYPDDHELCFSGLTFKGLKQRSDDMVQIEFVEPVNRTRECRVVVETQD